MLPKNWCPERKCIKLVETFVPLSFVFHYLDNRALHETGAGLNLVEFCGIGENSGNLALYKATTTGLCETEAGPDYGLAGRE